MRRGRDAALGRVYSRSSNVTGSTVPILLVPNSAIHGRSRSSTTMPYGREPAVGSFTTRMRPDLVSSFPTALPFCTVNQMSSGNRGRGCADRSVLGELVGRHHTEEGSMRLMVPLRLPESTRGPGDPR